MPFFCTFSKISLIFLVSEILLTTSLKVNGCSLSVIIPLKNSCLHFGEDTNGMLPKIYIMQIEAVKS